ncbi:MAG: Uma2 family endonuclease [Lachnospiraceae bacterium]|nr:Uma2 family endonuclease [Lachnospiraceae bacterium]
MEVRKVREWNESEARERFMEIKGGRGYTIADIESLPEGERAELIDGEMFMMASPLRIHQKMLSGLFYEIMSYIKNNNGTCEVYVAPFAVRIKQNNRNYAEPELETVSVYDFEHNESVSYAFSERVKAGIFENLWLDFSEMDLD